MRTPDMSDEELDALFQRGAENYPDEYNLSAWLQMERKLDAAAAQQLVRQRVLRIFALEAVVVLLALLGWFGLSQYQQPEKTAALASTLPAVTSPAETNHPQPATQARIAAATALPTRPQSGTPRAALVAASIQQEAPASPAARPMTSIEQPTRVARPERRPIRLLIAATRTQRQRATVRAAAESRSTTVVGQNRLIAMASAESSAPTQLAENQPSGQPLPAVPGGAATGAATDPTRPLISPSSPLVADDNHTTAPAPVAPETAVAAATQPGSEPLPDRSSGATLVADSAVAAVPAVAPATTPALPAPADSVRNENQPSSRKPTYRLSIGGLYAPELSTVGWTKTTSPGSNLGVLVEYRFTDRLRLNVAAIRSVKRYVARGSDYTVPDGTWTGNYTIDKVDAVCRITDLPINLRYDVVHSAHTAVFVSAGLTSLLMRDEQYSYDYEYYGKYYSRDWNVTRGSNHWLSVVNLSAGYERSLASRWSGQVEPFVKVPLGGVGFGKVKLSSAGVFFSLKYHLLPTH
ncbi:hypothetical protein [Hymenobacter metallicola]|uniref:Outer membrane protein beta-barrel domain-containing protein n=1 Tax=Hymenobacter metallicola TaxID=2563114 RepID=A0A4Z0QAH0_9BACT|nr:hypothetical protein [Hymenobacter metallicola]TGE27020.1 hypothetical protein E5K02_11485 [Hymenobacter metallicola]